MQLLRSLLFNLFYPIWTLLVAIIGLPALLGPYRWIYFIARLWGEGVIMGLRVLCGITYEARGTEHITALPIVYASKHQSACDIPLLLLLLPPPSFVLKGELLRIPLVGWYIRRLGIAIDRKGGMLALKNLLRAAKHELHQRRPLIIFPEGTRTRPGTRHPYLPGVAALYDHLMVPAVPVALNSGLYWPKHAWLKKPGKIIVQFLPPLPPGLPPREMLKQLEEGIENASAKLLAEAQ